MSTFVPSSNALLRTDRMVRYVTPELEGLSRLLTPVEQTKDPTDLSTLE